MVPVRSPERRDETTISIAVALLIFAGVLGAGGVVIHVGVAALGLSDDNAAPLMTALALAAAVVSGRYLIRQDRA